MSVNNFLSKHVVYLWVPLSYLYFQRVSASNIDFNTIWVEENIEILFVYFSLNAVRIRKSHANCVTNVECL